MQQDPQKEPGWQNPTLHAQPIRTGRELTTTV